jgi:hypothetical protein
MYLLHALRAARMGSTKGDGMADRFDFTGREAERLRAEHALLLNERQGQIGMVNGDVVVVEEGIWDPFTGRRLSPHEGAAMETPSRCPRISRGEGERHPRSMGP